MDVVLRRSGEAGYARREFRAITCKYNSHKLEAKEGSISKILKFHSV
jgi:hypothetical protein